jgi:archaemetzincin
MNRFRGEIVLVPVGGAPPEVGEWLGNALPPIFGCACRIGSALPHPAFAWNARRQQYRGEPILAQVRVEEASCALAIADLDLFVPRLNFIFGLAERETARAIIALPRLRQSYYGLPGNIVLFRERVVKEGAHELGHVWGLGHCRDPRCVMAFSNSLSDTDNKGWEFCVQCRKQVRPIA